MRIPIIYDRERPPHVLATVSWDLTGTSAPVDLVVDTGAFDIVLSLADVAVLGAEMDRLDPAQAPVRGVGGAAGTFDLRGVSVAFMGDGLEEAEFDLGTTKVMGAPERSLGHAPTPPMPSLLGRKFMEDNGFILFWDFGRRIAFIDITGTVRRHSTVR